jgi:hypothetical protein
MLLQLSSSKRLVTSGLSGKRRTSDQYEWEVGASRAGSEAHGGCQEGSRVWLFDVLILSLSEVGTLRMSRV